MPSRELTTILAALRARPSSWEAQSISEWRSNFETIGRISQPLPEVRVEPLTVAGIAAEWLLPPEVEAERTILYLHGGAYVIGSLATHRGLASRLALSARARVLTVEYRLAPEHPFPAAVDDTVTAWRWLLAEGVDPRHLAVVGDSAGGGLTVATAMTARDGGDPLPAALAVMSPSVDLEGRGESFTTRAAEDPLIQRSFLLRTAELYLAGADPLHPLASPLYGDLSGLPPLFVQVGTAETLLDDSTRLAARARAAGVEVTLRTWEGMFHGWQHYAKMLPEGQQAIDEVAAFVRRQARPAPPAPPAKISPP